MPSRYWHELKKTFNDWLDHDGPRLAASLSLYSLLSLAPLVVLSISIASLAFGRTAAESAITRELGNVMGPDGARTIHSVISTVIPNARASPPRSA